MKLLSEVISMLLFSASYWFSMNITDGLPNIRCICC